ncbi:hypothetical protein PUH89_05730 [Rhodobacter capsulatus]|nr:hypothetical protein [Rhodobacter capsulatus]WER10482.1 hypothetical protein PUH89_05730 [Rhodobacter capsulatus]
MGEDTKKLFRRILIDFTTQFDFALTDVELDHTAAPAPQGTQAP